MQDNNRVRLCKHIEQQKKKERLNNKKDFVMMKRLQTLENKVISIQILYTYTIKAFF